MYCAKRLKRSRCRLLWSMYWTGVKIGQIHLHPARGDKSAMQPFVKLLWALVHIYVNVKLFRCQFAMMMLRKTKMSGVCVCVKLVRCPVSATLSCFIFLLSKCFFCLYFDKTKIEQHSVALTGHCNLGCAGVTAEFACADAVNDRFVILYSMQDASIFLLA